MYEKVVDLLKRKNVVLDDGLTVDEIVEVERMYGIIFPKSLRNFLSSALPISKGFYNWRNKKQVNIEFIKSAISQPIRYISEMPEDIYWCENWGEEPKDEAILQEEVKRRLGVSPKLVPIFSHRYIPLIAEDNPPIISVHGADIIYMGENIDEYLKVEFGEKNQREIDFSKINPIPFWSELM